MAASVLTIKLVDGSSVTVTAASTTADVLAIKQLAQSFVKSGGFFDDAGAFHPSSAIVTVTFA